MSSHGAQRHKYFALSFISAFLAFWLVFLFVMGVASPSSAPVSADSPAPAVYQPREEDAITLLVLGAERHDVAADTFLLLRFDPVRGQVGVVAFPPGTVLTHNDRGETLADAHRLGGSLYTRGALADTLNIPIDRFARITLSGFVTAAAAVGSVEFTIEEQLSIHDGELSVTLAPGTHLLDGRQVAAIIRYQGYPGGQAQRMELTAALASAVIDQRIDIVHSTLLAQAFQIIINLLDTDITYADFAARLEAARALADLGHPIARPITLQGQFCEAAERFTLSDTAKAQLAHAFL